MWLTARRRLGQATTGAQKYASGRPHLDEPGIAGNDPGSERALADGCSVRNSGNACTTLISSNEVVHTMLRRRHPRVEHGGPTKCACPAPLHARDFSSVPWREHRTSSRSGAELAVGAREFYRGAPRSGDFDVCTRTSASGQWRPAHGQQMALRRQEPELWGADRSLASSSWRISRTGARVRFRHGSVKATGITPGVCRRARSWGKPRVGSDGSRRSSRWRCRRGWSHDVRLSAIIVLRGSRSRRRRAGSRRVGRSLRLRLG
jgi:hypothetical protein